MKDDTIHNIMKTPTGYVALRKGRNNVRNCIFLNWFDAEIHIAEFDKAEYSVIDSLKEAEKYIISANLITSATSTGTSISALPPENVDTSDTESVETNVAENINANNNNTKATGRTAVAERPSTPPPLPPATIDIDDVSQTAAALSNSNSNKNDSKDKQLLSSTSNCQNQTATGNNDDKSTRTGTTNRKIDSTTPVILLSQTPEDNIAPAISRNATDTSGTPKIPTRSAKKRTRTSVEVEGDEASSATYEDEEQPNNCEDQEQEQPESETTRPKKRIKCCAKWDKKWEDNVNKLKQYMTEHNGDWNVKRKYDSSLRWWLWQQKSQYLKMKEGKRSRMNHMKLDMLKEIGVDLDTVVFTWSERIEQLKKYKDDKGHLIIPRDHPLLGEWVWSIKLDYERILAGKSKTTNQQLDSDKVDELQKAGVFDFLKEVQPGSSEYWNKNFDIMIEQLKEFKTKYGNCYVKRSNKGYEDLYTWYRKVQIEYRKSSDKNTAHDSLLTSPQIVQLNKIGFETTSTQITETKSFEERIEQLKEYQRNGGDINKITRYGNDISLGRFVDRMRTHYRYYCHGQKSKLNDGKIQKLQEIGFDFRQDRWKDPKIESNTTSWDARFQQLLDYKAKNGHMVVPKGKGLGRWVRSQRQHYKWLLQGKNTSLTVEKAMKLTDAGFVFDASKYRFKGFDQVHNNNNKNKEKNNNDSKDNDDSTNNNNTDDNDDDESDDNDEDDKNYYNKKNKELDNEDNDNNNNNTDNESDDEDEHEDNNEKK